MGFVILRLKRWDASKLTTDFTLAEDMYIVWSLIEVYYSIASATIPNLRPFMQSLTTFYGQAVGTNKRPSNPQTTPLD